LVCHCVLFSFEDDSQCCRSKASGTKSDDVAELFIENRPDKSSGLLSAITGLFATHPPIDKRMELLEQF
jgi:heat shock protein HtpX